MERYTPFVFVVYESKMRLGRRGYILRCSFRWNSINFYFRIN